MSIFSKSHIKCQRCRQKIKIGGSDHIAIRKTVSRLVREGYTCDQCVREDPLGQRYMGPTDVFIASPWRATKDTDCIICGNEMWSVRLRFTVPKEFALANNGEPVIFPAGTEMEYQECPNPYCDFAWGNGRNHEIIVERYQFLIPPWAETAEESSSNHILSIPERMKRQRQNHLQWWDAIHRSPN